MKITVEVSEKELREICQVTGEAKKGPAIRKLLLDALKLKRRARLTEKFISGEWGVELATFDRGNELERQSAVRHDRAWRR